MLIHDEPLVTLDDIRAARRPHQAAGARHAAPRTTSMTAAAPLAPQVREPAAQRRVQDPRRREHAAAAVGGRTRARRHHLLVGQPRHRHVAGRTGSSACPAVVVMPTTAPAVKVDGRARARRRDHLRGHDDDRAQGAGRGRGRRARPDHRAAVRSPVDHRRQGHHRPRDPRAGAGGGRGLRAGSGGGLLSGVATAIKQPRAGTSA